MDSTRGTVPAYLHIKSEIVEWIASGKIKAGDPLPGRWQLVKDFNTSWGTLNRAVSELIIEGILRAEKGKGTFINEPEPKQTNRDSRLIKVFICHPQATVYHSLGQMMDGIREEAYRHSYRIESVDQPITEIDGVNLDGYIIITPTDKELPALRKKWNSGQRFIVLGSDFPGGSIPCINADTRHGTFRGVEHLIHSGHTQIALFGVQDSFPNYQREIEGYRDAMFRYNLPIQKNWIVRRDDSMEETAQLFERWLLKHPECSALFSADYASTLTILSVCDRQNISIPADLAIVTMDEIPSGEFLRTPLTAVVQPFVKLGNIAASYMIDKIDDSVSAKLLPCSIQYRQSVNVINVHAGLSENEFTIDHPKY